MEQGVYRSALPVSRNMPFLKQLGLRCIVSLTPSLDASVEEFCIVHEVRLQHVQVRCGTDDEVTITHTQAQLALAYLLNPDMHPLLVHCIDGGVATGMLIMCLRKLQCYGQFFPAAEFLRFVAQPLGLTPEQLRFVETYRREVLLDKRLPPWLWQGRRIAAHPSIPVRDSQGTEARLNLVKHNLFLAEKLALEQDAAAAAAAAAAVAAAASGLRRGARTDTDISEESSDEAGTASSSSEYEEEEEHRQQQHQQQENLL